MQYGMGNLLLTWVSYFKIVRLEKISFSNEGLEFSYKKKNAGFGAVYGNLCSGECGYLWGRLRTKKHKETKYLNLKK